MTHYKTLLDPSEFLGVQDFPAEREVTISRIVREKMPKRDGEKETASPMLYVKGKDGSEYPRRFKVPKSVLYGLSEMLGTEIESWAGQKISIFATKCMAFGEIEPCLRVRFSDAIDGKVRKWLKKRKANPSAYMIADQA